MFSNSSQIINENQLQTCCGICLLFLEISVASDSTRKNYRFQGFAQISFTKLSQWRLNLRNLLRESLYLSVDQKDAFFLQLSCCEFVDAEMQKCRNAKCMEICMRKQGENCLLVVLREDLNVMLKLLHEGDRELANNGQRQIAACCCIRIL